MTNVVHVNLGEVGVGVGSVGGQGPFMTMALAPRDGTIIEIMNNYGIMPWWGIFRWIDNKWKSPDGSRGLVKEHACTWRPYGGKPEDYRDPTNGMQNSPRYWGGR